MNTFASLLKKNIFLQQCSQLKPFMLTYQPCRTAVNMYRPRPNLFERALTFKKDESIEKTKRKDFKPRQAKWDDPKYNWPPEHNKNRATMHSGKALIAHLEHEYVEKIAKERQFKIPDVRTGDVVEATIFHSLSEGKFKVRRGIVMGRKGFNSLASSYSIMMHVAGKPVEYSLKKFSPMLAKLTVLKYGLGNLRQKLYYLRTTNWPKHKYEQAITKGRMVSPRKGRKGEFIASKEGFKVTESVKLDTVDIDRKAK